MKNKNLPSDLDSNTSQMSLEVARKILGKVGKKITDEQLQDQLSMIQYLVESWVDEYEKSISAAKDK